MSVDRSELCCTSKGLPFYFFDMLVSIRIYVADSKSEINRINLIRLLSIAKEKIIRLDVSVNETLSVDFLNSLDKLVKDHADCFYAEFSVTELKKIFNTWAEVFGYHKVYFS